MNDGAGPRGLRQEAPFPGWPPVLRRVPLDMRALALAMLAGPRPPDVAKTRAYALSNQETRLFW